MPIKPLHIDNYEALGKLIKTWSLKEDRVKNGGTYLPPPTTLAGFTAMVVRCGATDQPSITDWIDSFEGTMVDFEIVQSTPQKLIVRLPMAQMVLNKEEEIKTKPYKLPPFYSPDFFAGEPEVVTDPLKAHNERIGDYTIAQCG